MLPGRGIIFSILFSTYCFGLGVVHIVHGSVRDGNGSIPPVVTFNAYVLDRPLDILTETSPDCFYQSGKFQVQLANFDNQWQHGEVVHVDVSDGSGNSGSCEVSLSSRSNDEMVPYVLINDNSTGKVTMRDTSFTRGETHYYPVYLSGLGVADSVVAYEITVGFDPEVVEAVDAKSTGTMTALWGAPFVGPKRTEVSVAGYTTNQPHNPLITDLGILVKIGFLVHGDPNDPTTYRSEMFFKKAIIYTLDQTYVISDIRNGQIVVVDNPTNTSKTITLYPNWNRVSLALSPEPNTIPEVFGGINVSYVYTYRGAEGPLSWDVNRPSFLNDLTYLDAIHGYDIKLGDATSQTWQITGDAVDVATPLVLYSNWNLIGYLPGATQDIGVALGTIDPLYSFVMGYEGGPSGGPRTWDRSRPGFLNDLTQLEPHAGYWIKMDSAATLRYSGGSPKRIASSVTQSKMDSTGQGIITYVWCDFWAYQTDHLSVGDTVKAYDSDGVFCGSSVVSTDGTGKVGFNIHVLGDDSTTPDCDEGAEEGDTIRFMVNGSHMEILGSSENFDGTVQDHLITTWTPKGSVRIQLGISGSRIRNDLLQTKGFYLASNYPNPFNPATVISYDLHIQAHTLLNIVNIRGEQVRTLFSGIQPAGHYQTVWDGRNDQGMLVSGGIYVIQLKHGSHLQTRKCLFMK